MSEEIDLKPAADEVVNHLASGWAFEVGGGRLTIGNESFPVQSFRVNLLPRQMPALPPETVHACAPPSMLRSAGFLVQNLGVAAWLALAPDSLRMPVANPCASAPRTESDYWDDFRVRVTRVGDFVIVIRRSGSHVVELTELQRAEDGRQFIQRQLRYPTLESWQRRLDLFRMLDEWAALDDISCRRFNHPEPLADELYEVLMARRDRVLLQYREKNNA